MSDHWSGCIYTRPIDGNTHILLTRTSLDNEWSMPGGKQEGNESPEETLIREVNEEIICNAVPVLLILKVKEPQHLRYIFDIEPTSEIRETALVQFFPLIRLPQNLRERHRQILCSLYRDYCKYERKFLKMQNEHLKVAQQPLSLAA